MRFSAIFLVFSRRFSPPPSLRTNGAHGLVHQTNFVGRFEQVEAHRFECELGVDLFCPQVARARHPK
jgi:hypothetical protein